MLQRLIVALVIAGAVGTADADAKPTKRAPKPPVKAEPEPSPPPPPERSSPWADGVPEAQQQKANEFFREANLLFAQEAHAPAVEKYDAAIALWDHPMIRFNLAVTLIRLDRILEAAESFDRALRYGDVPFTPELYKQAMDYHRLVGGRVGVVDASCTQQGARVTFDGKPWFACPGSEKRRVLAGEHAIVAEATGYMTLSLSVIVPGGGTSTAKLELMPIEKLVKYEYPTPRWIPWTLAGAGATIGLGGAGLWFSARNQMDRFKALFAVDCASGCAEDLSDQPALRDQHDGARLKSQIAISMMIAGGTMAVVGTGWALFVNRPRRILPVMEVTPQRGGGMAQVGWRF